MIFDKFFEIGLLILGLLYVGNMYFDSCLHLLEIANDMDEKEKEEEEEEELKKISKHMYS